MYDSELLSERPGRLRGVVMNSQIANACTGEQGLADATAMVQAAEAALELPPRSVLVLSTGRIGVPLPIEDVTAAIGRAAEQVQPDGGVEAARAIMTTDQSTKHIAVQLETGGGVVTVGGVAKGSMMIHPDMATMLSIITTDAKVDASRLAPLLGAVSDRTFNAITIDGDTSPNDSVVMLANGASKVAIARDAEGWKRFELAVESVARDLALMIVRDGLGASRLVELTVSGAATDAMARSIGRKIGSSVLVKTGWSGDNPDWGLMFAAAGGAGLPIEPNRLKLQAQVRADAGGPDGEWVLLADAGIGVNVDPQEATRIFAAPAVAFRLELGLGGGEATIWTCDMTEDYVRAGTNSHNVAGCR
jgi:glutamate N-acetyltransferase/amino-acid N-acetyltransferase